MAYQIYEIPDSVYDLFEQGEAQYRIVNYEPSMEMDNIQSMNHFCELVGISSEYIESDDGTQIILKHPEYENKLVIDAGGLGDFFSHSFDVSLYQN